MKIPENGVLLRIYISESDEYEGQPLYEVIVKKARGLNLAGATVLKGIMGFGAGSRIHTSKILRLSENMPLVIEIVDLDENIEKILPFLDEAVQEGLITQENVRIVKYRHNK